MNELKFIAHLYIYNKEREVWEYVKDICSYEKVAEIITRCVNHPETIRVAEISQIF